jgi:hypothetical protein
MNTVVIQTSPQWLRKRDILKMFDVGYRKLNYWTDSGYIRSLKFNDESQQGTKLYYIPDIEDLLLKLSAGYTPQLKHGRTKP